MVTLFNIRPRALNVGNDIIAVGLRIFLSKAFGEVVNVINLPATAKYESQNKAGLDAQTIYEINQYGHGVIVGGGNLYENGELQMDMNALPALEPPLMLFSLSMGRVYGRLNRLVRRTNAMPDAVLRALNEQAMISLARDTATLEHLHGLGLSHARLGGCPTIFLDDVRHRLPDVPEQNRDLVLISVRTPSLMSIPLGAQSRVRSDIERIVEMVRERGWGEPRLLCHDYRDIAFAASFEGMEYVYVDDAQMLLALLASCRLNITYRLHSTLPCFSFGVPCVPISYDERGLSAIDAVGFGDWNIDMIRSPDTVGDVADRLNRLKELPAIRKAAEPVWQRLHNEMDSSLGSFAKAVRAYRAKEIEGVNT